MSEREYLKRHFPSDRRRRRGVPREADLRLPGLCVVHRRWVHVAIAKRMDEILARLLVHEDSVHVEPLAPLTRHHGQERRREEERGEERPSSTNIRSDSIVGVFGVTSRMSPRRQ